MPLSRSNVKRESAVRRKSRLRMESRIREKQTIRSNKLQVVIVILLHPSQLMQTMLVLMERTQKILKDQVLTVEV